MARRSRRRLPGIASSPFPGKGTFPKQGHPAGSSKRDLPARLPVASRNPGRGTESCGPWDPRSMQRLPIGGAPLPGERAGAIRTVPEGKTNKGECKEQPEVHVPASHILFDSRFQSLIVRAIRRMAVISAGRMPVRIRGSSVPQPFITGRTVRVVMMGNDYRQHGHEARRQRQNIICPLFHPHRFYI